MNINKILILIDNFAIKLSKTVSTGLSQLSNILRLKRNYRIIDWNKKTYTGGYGMTKKMCYFEEVGMIPKVIFKGNI